MEGCRTGSRHRVGLVLAGIVVLAASGCAAPNFKLAPGQAFNESSAYIAATDSGGLSPVYHPEKITVDGKVVAEGKALQENVFYAVKPGTHKVLVRFHGSSLLAIVRFDDPALIKKIEMAPGTAYLAVPRVLLSQSQLRDGQGHPLAPEDMYSLAGGIYQVKKSVVAGLK